MELLCECDTLLRRGGGFAKGGDVIAFTPKEALERRNGIIRKTARERTTIVRKYMNPLIKTIFYPKACFLHFSSHVFRGFREAASYIADYNQDSNLVKDLTKVLHSDIERLQQVNKH